MHLLFDEAGKFLAGRILSETDASAQVELDSGKRVKVKAANQLLRFEQPGPTELLAQAQAQAAEVDPALAWEFAPETEFGFADLATDYFGDAPGPVQQAAALLALHEAPHYFRRAGKGRYRKAPADIVAQALAAIEKKKQIAAQVSAWADALARGECPAPIGEQLYRILFKPDKNAPEYKAVVEAARATQMAPLALLTRAGAISSPYQFHWQRFLFENFPRGTGFPPLEVPQLHEELPLAPVQAVSIDDAQTTEIDDALSLRGLGSGRVVLGIHIAAPGLAIAPGDALDEVGRARLSTVYMPGHKITMLPDAVVQAWTLTAGQAVPALSLYLTLDEASLAIEGSETRLERVPIAANLRHDQLDGLITNAWLEQADAGADDAGLAIGRAELAFLYNLAQHLKARREQVRGKPEPAGRPDYSFRLVGQHGEAPSGDETVVISQRQRGAPLDLVVSELMILANSTWGDWLKSLGVPGIYRSQASLAPGIRVRMGTRALPHAGIGVSSYAWSTSPLRRYVDLVNQWQLIACARHGKAAALAAPFKPKDAQLLAIVSAFDAAYAAYGAHQASMERFWTLRHLQQHGTTELTATLLRELPGGAWLVRADTLPLVFSVMGAQALARGAQVRVRLGNIDPIALDVHGSITEVLAAPGATALDNGEANGSGEDEDVTAGPLAIAVELDEAEAPAPDPTAP
ncbi:MAG TPA: RNB domain-containing ribonuclease [Ottowia sp.]|uniref:ribonuclease catalytic domain-containing protein n=1 Tax=Ottowia sp. TaxID=1898956 RepID=UPI002C64AD53|nr:ribonuclease catalytic domain-containing protein [Ottowia sp.]HMN22350.1 RNB domain-containing ribonuclease [Ottowia sp.]